MDSLQTISSDLVQSITEKEKKKSIPYDTYAKVIRIDGGTAWVHIPGGVDETPVALTVNAKVGDSVLVRVSGGNAWIVGNSSAPPTDDTKAVEAKGVADVAQVKAASAQETAESAEATAASAKTRASSALEIAEGTNEHFWHDNTGAHITQITQEEWQDTPAGGNTLITSEGMAIRDGMISLAVFGADGARIGQNGLWHIEIDSVSFSLVNPLNVEYVHIGAPVDGVIIDVFGYPRRGDGINYVLAQTPSNTPIVKKNGVTLTAGTDYTLVGKNLTMTTALGAADEVTVEYTTAQSILFTSFGERAGGPGDDSFAEGHQNIASGYTSHAEGRRTLASGQASHAEGELSSATGRGAHAEGNGQASGEYSHAEGKQAESTNDGAHAEGAYSVASGIYAHAEGEQTLASGRDSHAQNEETVAAKKAQTAIGTFNEQDTATTTTHPSGTAAYGKNAVIIGNGEDNNTRSNALTVDWRGNVDMAGKLQNFFSIVNLEVAVGQVAAHAQSNIGAVTVPTADRPDGMTLVGIVGVACNNYRVVPYNYYVDGAHSITCAVVNTTTAQSAAGTTMTFKLLYAKMASA